VWGVAVGEQQETETCRHTTTTTKQTIEEKISGREAMSLLLRPSCCALQVVRANEETALLRREREDVSILKHDLPHLIPSAFGVPSTIF
jgi:hypothetical protein